jgi:hypothetical protein
MKTRARVFSMLVVAAMLVASTTADAAKMKKGGLVGNSYASQAQQINDTTLRITTRKMVSGDLDEVNKPGTTMYNALVAVQNGASARGDGSQEFGLRRVTGVGFAQSDPGSREAQCNCLFGFARSLLVYHSVFILPCLPL